MRALAGLLVAMVAGASTQAGAQSCMEACLDHYDCAEEAGRTDESLRCMKDEDDCKDECGRKANGVFGAIAYSPGSGAWGESHMYDSERGAVQKALSECAESASDCRIVVTYRNGCAAVATGKRGSVSYATEPAEWANEAIGQANVQAEAHAIANCINEKKDVGCDTLAWSCSVP